MNYKKLFYVVFILLLFLNLSFSQTGEDYKKLERYRSEKKYKEFITFAEKIIVKNPNNLDFKIYLADVYTLANKKNKAINILEEAVLRGFNEYLEFILPKNFISIKNNKRFKKMVAKAKKSALLENKKKAIILNEGEWTKVDMSNLKTFPKISLKISFDKDNLYIKAKVKDKHFKDGNRAWRYGDGFFINFASPDSLKDVYTKNYYGYGFCLENGKPIATLINRDGIYSLRKISDMAPKIKIDRTKNVADYKIKIPWSKLYPFYPLSNKFGGINIIYNSQNDNNSITRVQYIKGEFDSERTKFRRFAPVYFNFKHNSDLVIHPVIENRLISKNNLSLKIYIQSSIKKKISIDFKVLEKNKKIAGYNFFLNLKKGVNILKKNIRLKQFFGKFKLILEKDKQDIWEDNFYYYDIGVLNKIDMDLKKYSSVGNLLKDNSVVMLNYQLNILKQKINEMDSRKFLDPFIQRFSSIKELYDLWKKTGISYGKKGYVLTAIRSSLDGTLQPFSLIMPPDFSPQKRYRLLVGLHGSGVDEVGFIKGSGKQLMTSKTIIIAPRGRGLSDWWTGKTEVDAIDIIKQVKKMFLIDRTLCYGFSMGGYGTWRLTMKYPNLFDAAIIISGFPYNPRNNTKENDMNNHIGKGRDMKYFVIHGTEDRSLSISDTDSFIKKLKNAGYSNIEYHRKIGGGHGNFDFKDILIKWLMKHFSLF